MSADNFITIRRKGKKWAVNDGCASTGKEWVSEVFNTRDEAIDFANEQYSEYGITYIEPIKENQ
jgi:hypothetical protein